MYCSGLFVLKIILPCSGNVKIPAVFKKTMELPLTKVFDTKNLF